ncbi:glycosyltransferase family 9 protein [Hoyosella sp. YIM 151337]|uniref:glycosyltransferase family 9 protein n=1 Tax=Hoyosella sp. YIM 151337 TaxID=2992742 RepID=UPI0022365010|nr:glycosyltransferase family 9 protein [Hoyosella sp. YIM 151337]MCW4355505.1 glycosyltransferase family 9 protein [Hoyosella sp. YIM 151337]
MAVTGTAGIADARPVVLVLRALGLGDLLTAVPALRALRRQYRSHKIILACPAPLRPLALRTGAVDAVMPTPGLGGLRWAAEPVDVAVNLHGSGPESHRDLLLAAPRKVITHHHPAFPELGGVPWCAGQHEVVRWCGLLAGYGIDTDPQDLCLRAPAQRSPAADCVLIHPGAAAEARRWPAGRFAEVVRWLHGRGEHVILTGSVAERSRALTVAHAAGLPESRVLAGRTQMTGLCTLVAGARLVVCGDTGVSHLATAFTTPSVTLFGPTSPAEWGPPRLPRHRVLWAGRRGDPHGATTDPGLLAISVTAVIEAVENQLGQRHTIARGLDIALTGNP